MGSPKYPLGSRVYLQQANGQPVADGDGIPARFRINAIDRVPRSGIWYRLASKNRTLQKVFGGWYTSDRLSPATPARSASPKLATQAPLRVRRRAGLLVSVDGAVEDLPMPHTYVGQQRLFYKITGTMVRSPMPAGDRAFCVPGRNTGLLSFNPVATRALAALGGSPTHRVYGGAIFVGLLCRGDAWGELPGDIAAIIRAQAAGQQGCLR
ncbi:hypothetical protein [Streptomyces olivoreticuli]|uniref:hypothetical protein n=1 Tax=Streptomyces olivoreticuli TaxID=68246 RepID=UPI000E21D9D9|nr:hypothetical protein [Streptomyces olivoreticuli]